METRTIPRARIAAESERLVRQGVARMSQRVSRDTARMRSLGETTRPQTSSRGLIQRLEKRSPVSEAAISQPVVVEKPIQSTSVLDDREAVKWAAWGALLISLVAFVFLGIYAVRKFKPEFEFQKFQTTQQQIEATLKELQLAASLDRVKSMVTNAHLQIFLYRDYVTAKTLLTNAKQELETLRPSFPDKKQAELKQLLDSIASAIREIRTEPLPFDEKLKAILLNLNKM
jgi:hypothetical protein